MSVDIDATADVLLLIWQKLCIVQYQYGSLSLPWIPEVVSQQSFQLDKEGVGITDLRH